jgi:hypothetical protein
MPAMPHEPSTTHSIFCIAHRFNLPRGAAFRVLLRQVADVAVDHAEQRDDRGLVPGDAVRLDVAFWHA